MTEVSIVVISKDEPALADTLSALRDHRTRHTGAVEVVVVDASEGRLKSVRDRHPEVQWLDFRPPPGVRVSIPHQRNEGVRLAAGGVIVFIDAGCVPREGWLERLLAPLDAGEQLACGVAPSPNGDGPYDAGIAARTAATYLDECPTINLAFARAVFDAVGGFDERFEYGSDIDFSWRVVDAGFRIRSVADAVVVHDWGGGTRQLRRAYRYGRARARLYSKHRRRLRSVPRSDPTAVVWPAYLLGLPLAAVSPMYLALLAIPAWRARHNGIARTLADHALYGLGVLTELAALAAAPARA